MKKGVWVLVGVIVFMGTGAQASPFKGSGVITFLDFSDPNHSSVTIKSESGTEKTVFLAESAVVVLEGKPVSATELKKGDVLDIDCEFDVKTQKTFVQRAEVVARVASEEALQEHQPSEDPEFE